VLNPLLLATVYFILVDILGRRGGPELFAHLVGALFAYYFVQQVAQQSVKSVTSGGKLILNSAFPRALLPLSAVVTGFMRFLPTLPVYAIVHAASGLPFGPEMLWLPVIMALLVLLGTGLAMILSAAHVYFRDVANFLPYMLRVWLYASPILYFADDVPDRYDWILTINPIAPILTAWSDVLDLGQAPGLDSMLLGLGWGLAFLVIGGLFFLSREREFAVRL
jgi:teichoic acid transport system permease protein